MVAQSCENLRYCILDPTGNITALVTSDVAVDRQPQVAAAIMRRHPQVEQVGFVQLETSRDSSAEGVDARLRMAGGEFCGNASICTAALWLMEQERQGLASRDQQDVQQLMLRVSGASDMVEVRLRKQSTVAAEQFQAAIRMPAALAIENHELASDSGQAAVPVVRLEGISHAVVQPTSAVWSLLQDRPAAERAVAQWCHDLGADGLGLMFLAGDGTQRQLTPLVYVADGQTCFWENSCASGSAATAQFVAQQTGAPVDLTLQQPGGALRVMCDPATQETWLHGGVRLLQSHETVLI